MKRNLEDKKRKLEKIETETFYT